jgi:hypothetical protein
MVDMPHVTGDEPAMQRVMSAVDVMIETSRQPT